MNHDIKRYAVYFNLAVFSLAVWYVVAELVLTLIWAKLWH